MVILLSFYPFFSNPNRLPANKPKCLQNYIGDGVTSKFLKGHCLLIVNNTKDDNKKIYEFDTNPDDLQAKYLNEELLLENDDDDKYTTNTEKKKSFDPTNKKYILTTHISPIPSHILNKKIKYKKKKNIKEQRKREKYNKKS